MTRIEIVESLKSCMRLMTVMKEDQNHVLTDSQWDSVSILHDGLVKLQAQLQESIEDEKHSIPLDPNEYWKKFKVPERKSSLVNTRLLKNSRYRKSLGLASTKEIPL